MLVSGRLNIREDRANSLLIERMQPLGDALVRTLYLRLPALTDEQMRRAVTFLQAHPGKSPVVLVDAGKRLQRQAPPSLHFDATDDALREAEELFGRENVKYQ